MAACWLDHGKIVATRLCPFRAQGVDESSAQEGMVEGPNINKAHFSSAYVIFGRNGSAINMWGAGG